MLRSSLLGALIVLAPALAMGQDAPTPAPAAAAAANLPQLLVLDIVGHEDLAASKTKVLSDLLITHLRATAKYSIISQADIGTLVGVETQKQLMTSDDSNIAELGGSLGAPWMVSSNVGLLDESLVLTLKLLDTKSAQLSNQLSQPLPDDEEDYAEFMMLAAYELVGLQATLETPWYARWWVWTIVGVAVAGGVAAGLAVGLQPTTASGNLGQGTF